MSTSQLTIKDAVYRLSQFNKKVDEAVQGGVFERVQRPWGINIQNGTIRASQGGHVWHLEFDGPGNDAIKAFCSDFGFFQKPTDKYTNVYETSNLYHNLFANIFISHDIVDAFIAQRDALDNYWKQSSPLHVYDFSQDTTDNILDQATGQPMEGRRYQLTNAELFRIFLYGNYLHRDEAEERAASNLKSNNQHYPALLMIFLHILSRSTLIIQEMATVNSRAIVRLQTGNQAEPLKKPGNDPSLVKYNPKTPDTILHLLAINPPPIAIVTSSMDTMADGTLVFND